MLRCVCVLCSIQLLPGITANTWHMGPQATGPFSARATAPFGGGKGTEALMATRASKWRPNNTNGNAFGNAADTGSNC